MSGAGFFAVGRDTFIKACDLGMNPACALLVLASGTGRDNSTTKWSAEAVKKYAGVRWQTASDAINAIVSSQLVSKGGTATRPTYKLKKDGELIWIPRALVEGAIGEVSPVARIRQTQDHMTLRLLIELYSSQNLREDGGISTKVIMEKYDRRKAGQQGAYTIWDFTGGRSWLTWCEITQPHRKVKLTQEEKNDSVNTTVDFFRRLSTLEGLGLLQWVPYLFDGEEGEPIHALASNGLEEEQSLYASAVDAAMRMLTEV